MPRKSLIDRRAEKLAQLDTIRKELAALELKAGERLGKLALKAGLGDLDLDASALLRYIEEVRHLTGVHLTLTHLVGKAVARGLAVVPELGFRLARGREHERESMDVFFIVTAEGGRELTGVKIRNADSKSATEIGEELRRRCSAIDAGTDPELGRSKALMASLPPRLLRWGLRVAAVLTSDLNLDLPILGMPRQAFGGAMITSVGGWGITHAYSPLAHYYRVPVLVLIGAGLVVLFVVIGYVITRDARQSLPEQARTEPGRRDQGPHRHAQQAKAKARAKTKAQRRARRQNR